MITATRIFGALEAAFGTSRTVDPLHPKDPALARMWGFGQPTHAGVQVNHDTTMAIPAVFRAINIISNGVARVPFFVFKVDEHDTKTFAKGHTAWRSVAVKPHPELKQIDFRRTMTAWAIGWGNAVAHIHRPGWPRGGPVELTPFLPDRTYPVRITRRMVRNHNFAETTLGKLYYVTRINDREMAFAADDCLHIRGLGPNPYWGYDIVTLLVEHIGGAQARAEFGHRFYGQGAQPAGFIEMQGHLDEEAEKRLVESLRRGAEGLGKAHRFMLLEDGAKFHQLTVDPEKAQFIEGMQFDYRVLANIVGIKPHKLIDGANTSYRSLEQANQEHRDDDLFPWILQWEGEYNDKMLTERQRTEMSHLITIDDEYLDGWVPFSDRVRGVVEMKNNDLITRDEGRRRLNFGPSGDRNGNRFVMPLNHEFTDAKDELRSMIRQASQDPPVKEDGELGDGETGSEEAIEAAEFEVAPDTKADELEQAWLDKIQTRLGKQAVKLVGKDTAAFITWVDNLTTESAPPSIQSSVDELYQSMRTQLLDIIDTPQADKSLTETIEAVFTTDTSPAERGRSDAVAAGAGTRAAKANTFTSHPPTDN